MIKGLIIGALIGAVIGFFLHGLAQGCTARDFERTEEITDRCFSCIYWDARSKRCQNVDSWKYTQVTEDLGSCEMHKARGGNHGDD